MKKLFGVLFGGAAALSLASCGDDVQTGVAYTVGSDLIQKATVTNDDGKYTVEFDGYYTFTRGGVHLAANYSDEVTAGYETADANGTTVVKYIEVSGTTYTFDAAAYAAFDSSAYSEYNYVDNLEILAGYVSGETTLLDYEKTITITDYWTGTEAAAIAFIDAYEAGTVKILKDASGSASVFAGGSYGHLNKSNEASNYWTVDGGLGWKGNIEAIEGAFEADSTLFDVDFTDTNVELGSATVTSKYTYAATIVKAYNNLA